MDSHNFNIFQLPTVKSYHYLGLHATIKKNDVDKIKHCKSPEAATRGVL